MTEDELVAAFESARLPAEQFSHAEHVRVAWWYLGRYSLPCAVVRFATALRRFAAAHGAAGKYHETVTVAWMLIIAERLRGSGASSWDAFAAANADLLVRTPSVLSRYYTDETLASERARQQFVLPDRHGLQEAFRCTPGD
jgi:hypothetical protein